MSLWGRRTRLATRMPTCGSDMAYGMPAMTTPARRWAVWAVPRPSKANRH